VSDILSQDEVDALLKGVSEGATPAEGGGQSTPSVTACDLTSQERALYGRMPGLDRIFDTFLRILRSSIETLLGDIGGVSLGTIELIRYGSWLAQQSTPLSVHLFRLSPLPGSGLLVLSPALSGIALEVAFGGTTRRQTLIEGRGYSDIETRVLQRFAARILSDFEDAWEPIQPLELAVLRSESNPAHAAIATEEALVLVAEIRVLAQADEELPLMLCIPYGALDAIRPKLTGEFEVEDGSPGAQWSGQLRNSIGDLKLNVRAELGSCQMSMRQVLRLKPGDVVPLGTRRDEPILVRVEEKPKFYGVAGMAHEGHAVRITDRVRQGVTGLDAA
jgi:flagellar motor switch protein FliM